MIKRPEKSENRHPFRLESPEKDADFLHYFFTGLFCNRVVSRVMRKFALVSGRNLLQGGGLTAPWLLFSGQGAKGQGRRYAARLAIDALRPGCYHPA